MLPTCLFVSGAGGGADLPADLRQVPRHPQGGIDKDHPAVAEAWQCTHELGGTTRKVGAMQLAGSSAARNCRLVPTEPLQAIYEWFDIGFDKFGRTPTRAQTQIGQASQPNPIVSREQDSCRCSQPVLTKFFC